MVRWLALGLVLACSKSDDDSALPEDDSGTVTDSDPGDDPGDWSSEAWGLDGALTWTVDFTKDAEAAGKSDCAYTRTYAAIQDWSSPWTCPECLAVFRADVTLDGTECYAAVTDGAEFNASEFIGVGAEGTFYRMPYANFPMDPQGSAELAGDTVTVHNEATADDGAYTLVVDGSLTRAPTDADPWHGYAPADTYACGWPKSNPESYAGPWELHIQQTVPDGYFKDACGENVRLHDFAGRYLVIDISASDCGPCQVMASETTAFENGMAIEHGIEVMGITLLAPSLSAILDDTPVDMLQKWTDAFELESAVLGDRGWGYAILGGYLGTKTFSYPSWAIVAPDLRVIAVGSGYSSGTTYGTIETYIQNDAAN